MRSKKRLNVEGDWGERCGNACKNFWQKCVPVYQILVYPLIGWFWQFLSTVERLRSQREMRYGGDDRLYVPSRRIRTRNKHSAEWLSKREGKTRRAKKCLKHIVGRIDVFAILPTGLGKSLIFQLFPGIKCALEWRQDRMPFTIVVATPLIAIMKDQVEH